LLWVSLRLLLLLLVLLVLLLLVLLLLLLFLLERIFQSFVLVFALIVRPFQTVAVTRISQKLYFSCAKQTSL